EVLDPQESFDSPHTFLGLVGHLLNQHPWEHSFSGGGQGNGKKPPPKIRGTQHENKKVKKGSYPKPQRGKK
ncbi:MAG TPA: hypothetical protein PLS49_09080, partial [Candidatus Woesebacteria bacterium]|nr:hypothetical protein [Candidatus Woesebacteria bacterium]